MRDQEHTCAHCAYYEPVAGDAPGQCRRRAPLIVEAGGTRDTIVFNGIWPAVAPSSWCGEFWDGYVHRATMCGPMGWCEKLEPLWCPCGYALRP